MNSQFYSDGFTFPRYAVALLSSAVLSFTVLVTSRLEKAPVYFTIFRYISFFTCIVWIYTIANEIVSLLTALGVFWNLNPVILGLTFLAWANSVGDLVADISLARVGKARTAVRCYILIYIMFYKFKLKVAACFGSPLLNLLCGVGIGCTITIASGSKEYVKMEVNMKLLLFIILL